MHKLSEILIATTNKGKLTEISEILKDVGIKTMSLSDIPVINEPIEDGKTFLENALIKARYYSKHFKIPVIADDSGLEVDALGGEPGINSARYSGESSTTESNNQKLLDEISLKVGDRSSFPVKAHFTAVILLYFPDGKFYRATGKVHGSIASSVLGEKGFGYDPLFIPTGYEESFAQLGNEVKNQISHRSKALAKLKKRIASSFNTQF